MTEKISLKKLASLIFGIIAVCFALVSISLANWTTPAVDPPLNNVAGPLNISSTAQGRIGNLGIGLGFNNTATPSTGPNAELDIKTGTSPHWGIYQAGSSDPYSPHSLRFWNTDNRLVITTSGNVGIGTINPISPLHTVASGVKTSSYSGNLLTNVATSSTPSINKAGLEIQSTGTWNGAGSNNIGLYITDVTGGTNNYDAIFNGNGANSRVGIGTISPTASLDINGTIRIQGGNPQNGSILISDATGLAHWGTCPAGIQGPAGTQQGVAGATGPQGLPGPQGFQGPTGPQGQSCMDNQIGHACQTGAIGGAGSLYNPGASCALYDVNTGAYLHRIETCNIGVGGTTFWTYVSENGYPPNPKHYSPCR